MLEKLYKWIWYKLGYLGKRDYVLRVKTWRSCVYDNEWGQRGYVYFIMPWSKERRDWDR